jgi:glucose dehydrogenase
MLRTAIAVMCATVASACSTHDVTNRPVGMTAQATTSATKYSSGFTLPVGDTPAEDGQWVRASKDYANTRFSALNQITAANVKQLSDAWSFSTGVLRGQEGAPLVVGSTMYYVTPYPNILYALDLANNGALKW